MNEKNPGESMDVKKEGIGAQQMSMSMMEQMNMKLGTNVAKNKTENANQRA